MTLREKLEKEHPESINPDAAGGCDGCPSNFGYDSVSNEEKNCKSNGGYGCECCWDREIPEEESMRETVEKLQKVEIKGHKIGPRILDSGNRRQFESGAVRDIHDGKGRCDLLPLDVVGHALANPTFAFIAQYMREDGDYEHLYRALSSCGIFHDYYTLFLEVAKHFEEGCKKYGDNNWQKGIPTHCYIDSAVRHYLKYLRGDKDEPHDRAFCWNILCCIWTCIHKPELNDYRKEDEKDV